MTLHRINMNEYLDSLTDQRSGTLEAFEASLHVDQIPFNQLSGWRNFFTKLGIDISNAFQ